ncbi:MAG: 4Fe-4S binding protein, partial [Thermoproteota archaeon]
GPGYLVFVCRQSAGELVEGLRGLEGARFPIFTVPVGCPYAVGLEELLAARALGLKPILACSQVDEGCREAGRIYAETVARDYERLAGERLEVLAVGEAAELLRGGDPGTRPLEGLEELWPPKLRHLAVGEAARLTRGRRGRVELATYFAGYVHVDRERCTLCGACAANCPTSALTLERGGAERLMFVNASCIACGYCAEVCPYNAIRVERAIEPSEYLLRKPRAESEMARCISCGKPVAPLRMLRGVAEELRRQGFGEEYVKAVYLCGECKTRYALGLLDLSTLRNPYEEGPAGG